MRRICNRSTALALLAAFAASSAFAAGELRLTLRADPKTFDPLQVTDAASEAVRYLTSGVLIRRNRLSQALEPELAVSWKVTDGGRSISFELRQGVKFSDGTPFAADDVAYSMRELMDPKNRATTGDLFRSGAGALKTRVTGPHRVTLTFAAPVAGLEGLFDFVSILSSKSTLREAATLGPFRVAQHRAGAEVTLERNPHYWKKDGQGRRLPYLDRIRLEIQQNRELELLKFRRGQLHMIGDLEPEMYERLAKESPSLVKDAGPSLDSEFFWFNQVANAPIEAHKKAWFRSQGFRRAISAAINRDDICRIVYLGHARAAAGPVSSGNRFWFNKALRPHAFDRREALRLLAQEGFRRGATGELRDREGRAVEFSLITNAGNKSRERMAAMIQQDLAAIGIRVNFTALDFLSLLERMSRTFQYEACLLGLSNVDLDPNAQMNVWLSSASNHQWNPNQKSPATAWEAEIDGLMREQASSLDAKVRKAAFDRVQQIVWEQAPFIYLVNRNSLMAVSASVGNAAPAALPPQAWWNAERLWVK